MKYKEKMYLGKFGYPSFSWDDKILCRFRFDPVPGSGGRYNRGSYYRQMKTTQEIRWSIPHKEYIRGKRSKRYLPDAWDDKPRQYGSKSWKDCTKRKQQFKGHGLW